MPNPPHPPCYGCTSSICWLIQICYVFVCWRSSCSGVTKVVVEACHVFCRLYRFVLHPFPSVARQYRNTRHHALRATVINAVSENVQRKPFMEVLCACACVRACVPASHLDVILYRLKRQTLASRLARLTRTDVRRTEPARQLSCRPAPVIRGSLIDSLTLQTTTADGRGEGCRIK